MRNAAPTHPTREWLRTLLRKARARTRLPEWGSGAWGAGPLRGVLETQGGWRKHHANPLLGQRIGDVFDVSVLHEAADDTPYRMWLSWRPHGCIAYSESQDGIAWSTPISVLEADSQSSWEQMVNRPSVLRRSDGYHLWYTGQTQTQSSLGYAQSEDGITWRRICRTPVLVGGPAWEGTSVMCPDVLWDDSTSQYRMWYSAGGQYEPTAIGYATSPNGVEWTKHPDNPVLRPQKAHRWERDRVSACHVVPYDGWHFMFYIGFQNVHRAQICLARSRDGIHDWERHQDNPIISPSPDPRAWDRNATYKPYALRTDEGWALWYNGRHGYAEHVGLAQLGHKDLGF